MKTLFKMLPVAVLIYTSSGGYTQEKTRNVSGLYENSIDYARNNLSSITSCESKHDKIKLNDFLGSSYVTVIHDGEKQRLPKNDLYGYHSCAGQDFRFYRNSSYKILDTADFYLYSLITYPAGKGNPKQVTNYYFSVSEISDIESLTINNLIDAFPSNHEFHYLLDQQFHSNNELSGYDSYSKKYKVKYIFERSNNKKR